MLVHWSDSAHVPAPEEPELDDDAPPSLPALLVEVPALHASGSWEWCWGPSKDQRLEVRKSFPDKSKLCVTLQQPEGMVFGTGPDAVKRCATITK